MASPLERIIFTCATAGLTRRAEAKSAIGTTARRDKPAVAHRTAVAHRFPLIAATLLLICVSCHAAEPKLLEWRKIWSQAPHSAFTDLIRHDGQWLCTFREGSSHVPGTDGVVRVIRSKDGVEWASAAVLTEKGVDLRDPKLCHIPDGRLMLLMGGSVYAEGDVTKTRQRVSARARVSFSKDGVQWTAPKPVSIEDQWLWRVTWFKDVGYGVAYKAAGAKGQYTMSLWKTGDGVQYEQIAAPTPPEGCSPNETTLRFLDDGTMIAMVRSESAPRHAFMARAKPPYKEWAWTDAGHPAQGPNFLVLGDGRLVYAGRSLAGGAKTVVGLLVDDKATPLLTLPSGGDTSYPGLVWHEHTLWVSYYASHEGKTSIYLAKVKL